MSKTEFIPDTVSNFSASKPEDCDIVAAMTVSQTSGTIVVIKQLDQKGGVRYRLVHPKIGYALGKSSCDLAELMRNGRKIWRALDKPARKVWQNSDDVETVYEATNEAAMALLR